VNPVGIYYGYLKFGVFTESGEKKTPTVALVFNVTSKSDGVGWVDIPPIERTVFLYCSDKAWPHTEPKLKSLGFNGDFGEKMDFGQEPKNDGVQLECKHSVYEGKTSEKWELVGAGGSFEPEPAPKNLVMQFNAKWKNANGSPVGRSAPAGRPAPPKPSNKPATVGVASGADDHAPITEDDIPF